MRKLIILVLCMFVFTGCNNQTKTEEYDNVEEEISDSDMENNQHKEEIEENKQNEEEEIGVEVFNELMTESALKSEFGYLALDTYFYLDGKLKYRDLDDIDGNVKASSFDEVKEAVDEVVDEANYELSYDESHGGAIATFFYLDPASTLRSYDDMINYADITFYFMEDQLYYSNISPGIFSLDIERIHLKEEFEEKYSTITDLENMDPQIQVFSLAKLQLGEKPIYQLMVPTRESEDDSNIIANYIHIIDGKEIASIHRGFNEVSQSFPRQSYVVFDYFLDTMFTMTEKD